MIKYMRIPLRLVLFGLITLATACPPSGPAGRPVRKAQAGKQEASLTSVQGLTAAILEMDAARPQKSALDSLRAAYEKEYKTQPKDPFKRFLWAYSLADRNQAWQELVNVTKLNDRFYWAYLGMGVILDEWKVFDQAESNFEKAISLGPNIALGYGRYGRMRLHKKDFSKAVELLDKAVLMAPAVVDFRMDLARAQAAAGQTDAAVQSYRAVCQKKPDLFSAHAELARVLEKAGDQAGAVDSFGRAVALDPEDYGVRIAQARLLDALRRDDEAVAAYQGACKVRPNDLSCWNALADLAARLSRGPLRVEALEQVVRIDYSNLAAHEFLAPTYLAEGAIEKALPSYQLLSIKKPQEVAPKLGLAQIYERGEEFSKAIEFYSRVLVLAPDQAEAKAALGKLFERFHILTDPVSGKTPEQVFAANRRQIAAVYKMLVEKKPGLSGDILLKVAVDDKGLVQGVSVAKDSVGEELLGICAYWNLMRSRFPAGFGATYDFELTLKPGTR